MVTDSLDVVIGVDTHRDAHSLALVRSRDGVLIAEQEQPATRAGYRAALRLGKRAVHDACGRSRARAPTARDSPATSPNGASGSSRSSAPPAKAAALV